MDETTLEEQPRRATRPQFPLWFLLFVLPTIAGLGFAIYANFQEQAKLRESLELQQVILQAKNVDVELEIKRWNVIAVRARRNWDRWKSADAVVDYLKIQMGRHEQGPVVFETVPSDSEMRLFFHQADDYDLRRLLQLMQQEYGTLGVGSKYAMFDLVSRLPQFVPGKVETLRRDVKELLAKVTNEDHAMVQAKANNAREAFQLDDEAISREAAS